MALKTYLQVALATPLRRLFDYLPPQGIDLTTIKVGARILVPFQSRTLVGIIVGISNSSTVPDQKLKTALQIIDADAILSNDIYKLCEWAADYYHTALGEVLASALPTLLRKGKDITEIKFDIKHELTPNLTQPLLLNAAQEQAMVRINASLNQFKTFLLDGITGSGKTEVYLQVMAEALQQGKQVLVLVPEISLTPQTIERFRSRFSLPMIALHSNLTENQRLKGWLAARAGLARIVIGTRSAIFTPMPDLGLIVVDEEHDQSFKQQDRFRYHARDLAIIRANINNIPVVLGSATPSLESLLNVKRNRYEYLSLPERAGNALLPQFEMIDLRLANTREGLSQPLLESMQQHLTAGNQVMLFLNKRGFAPVFYCTACSWIAGCKRCDARMVYHRHPERLQCHHCDVRSMLPKTCGSCGGIELQPVGLGTQRLEEELAKLFPTTPIVRVDRDSTRKKGALVDLLAKIHEQQPMILLGTQMLAKGHHFPQVTLVGIIDIDSGLFSADFRAAEQMGQLLLQVSGRAGREEKPGTVIIQTRNPEHPLLLQLIQQGYQHFSQALLIEREQAALPPYAYFAVFRAEAYAEKNASSFLTAIKQLLPMNDALTLLGPVPAMLAKRKGLHCQHLLIKANKRSTLQQYLKTILQKIDELAAGQGVKWILDVDPLEV